MMSFGTLMKSTLLLTATFLTVGGLNLAHAADIMHTHCSGFHQFVGEPNPVRVEVDASGRFQTPGPRGPGFGPLVLSIEGRNPIIVEYGYSIVIGSPTWGAPSKGLGYLGFGRYKSNLS